MAFLDNLNDKLSQLGNGAARKTKSVMDSTRINTAIREEENRRKDLFCQIGEYYYSRNDGKAEGQLAEWFQAVDVSSRQIKMYQDQLTRLKGVIICPNCHSEIPANSAFCVNCGTRLPRPANSAPTPAADVCPRCGQPYAPGQAFCVNCGLRLPEPGQPDVSQPAPNRMAPNQPEPGPDFIPAPAPVNASSAESNAAAESNPASASNPPSDTQAAKNRAIPSVCPRCGKPIEEGQDFCSGCGFKF